MVVAPLTPSVKVVAPRASGTDVVAVPPVGIPLQGAFNVVPVWETLAAPLHEVLLAIILYQYWVRKLRPLITAEVPE